MAETLGQILRERRKERSISLSELAAQLGVSKPYVSMLENGRRVPSDAHFDALAQALDVPADVLRVAAGRLPPDVTKALPKRAAAIVSAVRRDDGAAVVTFPERLSPDLQRLAELSAAAPHSASDVPLFTRSLRVGKNSRCYRAHSYHTKVPPEAIDALVRHYTREGDIVADPFCGSGMTGVAAIRAGRHALLSDFSPAAVHIARNYTTPCDPKALREAVARVADRVKPTMAWLYEIGSPADRSRIEYTVWSDVLACPACEAPVRYWEAARDPDSGAVRKSVRCGSCGHDAAKRKFRWIGAEPVETNARNAQGRGAHPPTGPERDLIENANSHEILNWIPQVPFPASREMWRAGHSAAGIDTVADFYTRRNLHALGALRHAILEEPDERVRAALLFAFTGMVNRASKRYQWNNKRPTNVMAGTLYVASLRYEWNVWSLFQRKAGDVIRYYEDLGTPVGRAGVVHASATSLAHLPDGCVDYVFMDPPFGSNIFYADCSLLWDAWLGALTDQAQEIVVNRHRKSSDGGKSLSDYQGLMADSFREVARVLKRSARATLQFNNSNDKVWCAIQDALHDAGLEVRHAVGLDKIHPSIKGVKGRQSKENVASLDALIELGPVTRSRRRARAPDRQQLQDAALSFARDRAGPFTTDQVFAHLVRHGLTNGASLSGVSMLEAKALCEGVFDPVGTRWQRRTEEPCNFDPVGSPYGCAITGFLASSEDVEALVDRSRPALDVDGAPPRVVAGKRNTTFYNAHSYHTKVPPEAIAPFIEHFTRPGDVVLDPFSGSGMTGVAAHLTGRRAVLSDLSVAAAHLTINHTRPCDPESLVEAFGSMSHELQDEFRDLYSCCAGGGRGYVHYTLWGRDARCPNCRRNFAIWDAIDRETGRMPKTLQCPHCDARPPKRALRYGKSRPVMINFTDRNGRRAERTPSRRDIELINRFTREAINDWYPQTPVESTREMFIRSALHLQGIETVADFYTPRNLHALARLWRGVQDVSDRRVRAALAFAFTNTAWHGTRMRRFNARGGQRPLTGTLYIPQISSEVNVLEVMRRKVRHLAKYYTALGETESPAAAVTLGSATRLHAVPDASIDYVFTDPPFGSNIFYADCNLIWDAWLGGVTQAEDEAVVNRSRRVSDGGKTVADYERLMTDSMAEISRVLKPGGRVTLVFHNTDPDVWGALQSAAEAAQFEIEDAGTLDRKQQSHKGYKGRAGEEKVAHFDVIMSMRKRSVRSPKRRVPRPVDVAGVAAHALRALPPAERTVQRVHSEVLQRLARNGSDLGSVSFEMVRDFMGNSRADEA